jgi:hypothetical protein
VVTSNHLENHWGICRMFLSVVQTECALQDIGRKTLSAVIVRDVDVPALSLAVGEEAAWALFWEGIVIPTQSGDLCCRQRSWQPPHPRPTLWRVLKPRGFPRRFIGLKAREV